MELQTDLDQTRMRYSYKQHCMVSLTVADSVDQNEWHLPTYDPRNETKYHYKLHSLDIYFWTQQDALQFVNGVRRVLPPTQVEILDEPGPPPAQQPANMSDVVQKLESAAISDPQYNASQPPSQPSSHGAAQPSATETTTSSQPANYAPMAYNPAAPAAPERIRHREKTPPPDEDPLNPLAVAVAYDYHNQPFTPGYPPQAQFPPGVTSPGLPPSVGSPGTPHQFGGPPHPGIQRAATMPAHTGMVSPGLSKPYGSGFPSTPGSHPPPPPPQSQPPQQPAQQQQAQQSTPPVTSPGLPLPPPGGYSNYSYSQQNQPRPGAMDYSIHQQLYRPTEAEATNAAGLYQPKQDPRGKLEENAGRLERGVSGMLKKFEKKFG